jgi:hypothetical protein
MDTEKIDANIERLINTDKFENVTMALQLAIGQNIELAFTASERYVELFCDRDGDRAAGKYTHFNLFATDYSSECSQVAELFGMLPHEVFEKFPSFIKLGVDSNIEWAYCEKEKKAERSACALHEAFYWK